MVEGAELWRDQLAWLVSERTEAQERRWVWEGLEMQSRCWRRWQ